MSDLDRNAYGWGEYNMEQDNYDSGQMGFQSFSYTNTASNQMNDPGSMSMSNAPADQGRSVLRPAPMSQYQSAPSQFDEELPLLEELGINPDHILQKTMSVLNPFRSTDAEIMRDTDLAGPLCFCLAFGGFLLLSGKIHFGYIYGIGCLGCLGIYALLNLLSVRGVGIGVVVSVLGYCLLPMVLLSSASIILSLQGFLGMFLAGFSIFWCSLSASKLFVTALDMDHQQPLIGYPCALLYGVFGLLTVF